MLAHYCTILYLWYIKGTKQIPMIYPKYINAEEKLLSDGFVKQFGNPLIGMRWKSQKHYAVLKRMGDHNYQIFYYEIIAEA